MRQWLLLTAAVMIVAWIITPPAWAKGRFDGTWKGIASTQAGPCIRYYVFPVTIHAGVIIGVVSG
jgi:hypothetical protein